MGNRGYSFEADTVTFWRLEFPDINETLIFRVEGGGRNKNASKTGTQTILEGDVSIELAKAGILPKDILIECKHHKNSRKKTVNHPLNKKWVDQARHEAEKNNRWSIVAIKFKNVRPNTKELIENFCWADGKDGNQIHYVIPAAHFLEIVKYIATTRKNCANTTSANLSHVSTTELIEELKKRIDE